MNLHVFLSIYCQHLRVQHQLSILTLVTFTANYRIALVVQQLPSWCSVIACFVAVVLKTGM